MALKDKDRKKAWAIVNKEKLRVYNRARYLANREATIARVRAYAAEHRDAISAKSKAYREKHKLQLSAKSKAYYEAHREERIAYQKVVNEQKREAVKVYKQKWWTTQSEERNAYRRAHPNERRIIFKKWYDRTYHAGQREKYLARVAKRKALKLATQVEKIDYKQVLADSKGLCGICLKPLDLFGIDFDHIIPLALGGTHTRDNLQASHSYCNRSKGARTG